MQVSIHVMQDQELLLHQISKYYFAENNFIIFDDAIIYQLQILLLSIH